MTCIFQQQQSGHDGGVGATFQWACSLIESRFESLAERGRAFGPVPSVNSTIWKDGLFRLHYPDVLPMKLKRFIEKEIRI
jgi:hypothetical protein